VKTEVVLAISTFPDRETAERISQQLIGDQLAACANLLPEVQSIYWWEGKIERAGETMVFFKTTAGQFERFRLRLQELHPYDVPEIVCVPVADGSPEYLRWVVENCGVTRKS